MTKKSKTVLSGLLAILLLLACWWLFFNRPQQKQNSAKTIATPTIFVHGWGSSYHAEESMANYARTCNATNSIIRADVSQDGNVTFDKTISANAKNPIIEVNLLNNKSIFPNETDQARALIKSSNYVKDVIVALQKNYHFNKINLVGHSMGNLQIAYYLKNNATNSKMPQLNKQVSIAGHYNGYLGEPGAPKHTILTKNGKPEKMDTGYKGLLSLRRTFPKNARVLNIYGNTGNGTDGSVDNNSSRSYRYLVSERARSYQEHEFDGRNAQHSKLHENIQVARLLVKFLWAK